MTTATDPRADTLARYEADLLSGAVFGRHAASARSIIGYQPPSSSRDYAKVLGVLAKAAALGDRHATLVAAAVRAIQPTAFTPGQNIDAMFRAVGEQINDGWFDVVRNASPEPGRRSDNEHAYGLSDRLIALQWLRAATACWPCQGGPEVGWCAAALIERERIPQHLLVTS